MDSQDIYLFYYLHMVELTRAKRGVKTNTLVETNLKAYSTAAISSTENS